MGMMILSKTQESMADVNQDLYKRGFCQRIARQTAKLVGSNQFQGKRRQTLSNFYRNRRSESYFPIKSSNTFHEEKNYYPVDYHSRSFNENIEYIDEILEEEEEVYNLMSESGGHKKE